MKQAMVGAILLIASISQAHSGGVKKTGPLAGCHNDRRSKSFHCHTKSPFNGRSWGSEEEALREVTNGRTDKSVDLRPNRSQIYDRKTWNYGIDEDGDCQDTRAEILIRDSMVSSKFKDYRECRVVSGKWQDFYTGELGTVASDFQIDHVVPLKHAHDIGGASWSSQKKRAFANDPLNLVVTLAITNRTKGANDFVNWQPPTRARTCEYAKRWFAVKAKYDLRVTETEIENRKALKCAEITVTDAEH